MTIRPPMIRTDHSNPFAHNTLKVRVPRTTRDVLDINPDYPSSIRQALARLAEDIENNAPILPLETLAPDYEIWERAYAQHEGHTWQNTDWFFAEIYFYRVLIEKVRWWETGRDPFMPKKAAELASPELWWLLERALGLRDRPQDERLNALIHSATWGNRIDLSFAASLAHGSTGSHDDLLADDSAAVVHDLQASSGAVHIVADNTGTELAMDMALTDTLLDLGRQVIFHLKMHPTFVSDATVPDVQTLIEAMQSQGAATVALGERLSAAWDEGRLRLAPDFYWNSSILLWDMPPRFADIFRQAALVIIKGDANYRRIVGDAMWPPETPFGVVTDYFPAPLLALRTLKSDPIVGLPDDAAERWDTIDKEWRVNGKRGVIQYRR
jgi:uncharacterized protein with ATP-grasp and redox domains